ncbi:hypothetical protein [Nostoc sp.]|uniref:hypothetical protein n=1 Tax=Nostoc sp. TaxID=1180 RepID=UPI002FEF2441
MLTTVITPHPPMLWLRCTHKSPVLSQYAWDKPETPHVETRFIASKKLARKTDAINRRLYKEWTRQLFLVQLLHNSVIANLDKSGQNERIVSFSKTDFMKRCRKYHNLGK